MGFGLVGVYSTNQNTYNVLSNISFGLISISIRLPITISQAQNTSWRPEFENDFSGPLIIILKLSAITIRSLCGYHLITGSEAWPWYLLVPVNLVQSSAEVEWSVEASEEVAMMAPAWL